ncbi:MAG: hypothetical protein Q7K28_00840 [Candidatus Wildermuthbacteria bacterium]|nr:hypothetical protein [Candidatus Wildermuthbacteria bacterium]
MAIAERSIKEEVRTITDRIEMDVTKAVPLVSIFFQNLPKTGISEADIAWAKGAIKDAVMGKARRLFVWAATESKLPQSHIDCANALLGAIGKTWQELDLTPGTIQRLGGRGVAL